MPSLGYMLSQDPPTVRVLQLSVVESGRLNGCQGWPRFGPDVAFEFPSSVNTPSEVNAKVQQFLCAGTKAFIVIEPESRTAQINRQDGSSLMVVGGSSIEVPEALPGWSVALRDVLPRRPEHSV